MNFGTKIKKGEYWYGGYVSNGYDMPFGFSFFKVVDLKNNKSVNQTAAFLVSNKGRYVWCEEGFIVSIVCGYMTIVSAGTSQIYFADSFGTMKNAYIKAQETFFKPSGRMPDKECIAAPQYCTWMACGTEQNEKNILAYAESILKAGLPAGELIIDDGWQRNFGDWEYDPSKTDNAKKLVEQLHKMGFKVVMWMVPFVSEAAKDFQFLIDNDALVRDESGAIARRKWWNGVMPVLDMSAPAAEKWIRGECSRIIEAYGVDGFKLDAGDAKYYRDSDLTHGGISANKQSKLWANLAEEFAIGEMRASFNNGGQGFIARIADRAHLWNKFVGLGSIIPNTLAQGIIGHPFGCPDMVGGGVYGIRPGKNHDSELFIRWIQASALLPSIQFSLPLWDMKNDGVAAAVKACVELRQKYIPYILELAENARVTGEPIVRYMEYNYPNEGLESVIDQFMLGDRYIVAPILKKHARRRDIYLPANTLWKNLLNDQVYKGGHAIEVRARLEDLPVLEKLN